MERTPSQVAEELLVLRAQAGDIAAFHTLITAYQPAFARTARSMAASGMIEDAVQEAWCAIARGLPVLQDAARFRPWAFRVLSNKCRDTIRQRVRDRRINVGRDEGRAPELVEDSAPVRQAIGALDDPSREVVALFYGAGLGIAEIARVLDVPPGTVKSRLFAARQELRRILEPGGGERD